MAHGLLIASITSPGQRDPQAGRSRDVHRLDTTALDIHVIGESAGEIIQEAAMAMKFKATLAHFIDFVHVYPTSAEALKVGAQAASRDVSKLSGCAE